jgi:hypothetical protein
MLQLEHFWKLCCRVEAGKQVPFGFAQGRLSTPLPLPFGKRKLRSE